MKRVLFLATHLCSGSESLFDSLASHPRIEGHRSYSGYERPDDLLKLACLPHKLPNSSAIHMDELVHNFSISSKVIYESCNYVFMIRRPRATLNEIIATKNYTPSAAASYYCFRLRRLCSIAAKSPSPVFLTEEDCVSCRGLDMIEGVMKLKEPLSWAPWKVKDYQDAIPHGLVVECEEAYERTHYFMRQACLSTAIRI